MRDQTKNTHLSSFTFKKLLKSGDSVPLKVETDFRDFQDKSNYRFHIFPYQRAATMIKQENLEVENHFRKPITTGFDQSLIRFVTFMYFPNFAQRKAGTVSICFLHSSNIDLFKLLRMNIQFTNLPENYFGFLCCVFKNMLCPKLIIMLDLEGQDLKIFVIYIYISSTSLP